MVSLISDQGYFTSLFGHTKHNIHNWEGGRKEDKQTWTRVSSKLKKGEVCNTFLAFSELSRACIQAKLPQGHQECWLILSRWPTRLLSPQVLATTLFCRLPWSVHFSWLVCSLPWPLLLYRLPPSLFCSGTFLPSFSSGLVGNLERKPFVWVSRQSRQRNLLTGLPTPTEMNATHRVTISIHRTLNPAH